MQSKIMRYNAKISVNNMINVLHTCKNIRNTSVTTPIAIGVLRQFYQDYCSETTDGTHITKAEYDCLCNLLLLPKCIRYGSKRTVERYIINLLGDTESYKRYCLHCDKVWHILFNLRENDSALMFSGTVLGIMEEIVYRMVKLIQDYSNAVYTTLDSLPVHGINELPIVFLSDFFNDYVMLNGAAESYTPHKFLQQYYKNIATYGEQAAVTADEYYEVVFKSNSRKLPIYGYLSTQDQTIYNPWVR